MDPKELAKLYAATMAKEAADRAAEKAADVAATKARESAAADAENALNAVAIPYLKEIKSAMAGNFTFDIQRDVTSNRTLGVKFEVKERHPVSIKLIGGAIQVRIHTGGGMIYPEIKVPSDLSKEKLGTLVQTIIEGWSAAHNGPKSDIAPCPKSANNRLTHCSKTLSILASL
jgi:hypothetical protein